MGIHKCLREAPSPTLTVCLSLEGVAADINKVDIPQNWVHDTEVIMLRKLADLR
jgi:hypothetical protein